jgi:hypothetical protein
MIVTYNNSITAEYARKVLDYDPDTGVLRWRKRPLEHFATTRAWKRWNTLFAGAEAGNVTPFKGNTRYRMIKLGSQNFRAHRLAWLIFHGTWPQYDIDHANGEGLDNRIENLSDTDKNSWNQQLREDNTSKINGVGWHKHAKKWEAYIRVNGRKRHLGYFTDKNDAIATRLAANKKFGFSKRHGTAPSPDRTIAADSPTSGRLGTDLAAAAP